MKPLTLLLTLGFLLHGLGEPRLCAQSSPAPQRNLQRLTEAPPPQPLNYHLRPNDLVHVKVFQEEDMFTTTRVGLDGTIQFPLIGKVKLSGLSVAAATDHIQGLLAKGLLKDPIVSVTLLEHAPQRFTILGQVQKPGTYDCPAGQELSLLAAIGYAGGYTRIANPAKVTVKRHAAVYQLDARKMAIEKDVKLFTIQPDDVITIGESVF